MKFLRTLSKPQSPVLTLWMGQGSGSWQGPVNVYHPSLHSGTWPQRQELLVSTQRQSGGTSSCGVGQTYPAAPSLLPYPSREALRQSVFQPNEPCGIHTPENKSHPEAERKQFDQKLWDFLRWAPSTAVPQMTRNITGSQSLFTPLLSEVFLHSQPSPRPPPSRGS